MNKEATQETVSDETLLDVNDLKVHFPIIRGILRRQVGTVKAVDGVSFAIRRGETLGLVGESGCGKTTTGRAIARVFQPTGGAIRFRSDDGNLFDVGSLEGKELHDYWKNVQVVFQDPYSSLNPRRTVMQLIGEPLMLLGGMEARERDKRVRELLDMVGLDARHAERYPHAFSGGQRQRIGIARGIALNPSLIIADEAVSALDVSVQGQVLNLMIKLQRELGLTYLFISHDLGVVKHVSDRIAVMYLGKLVELASYRRLFRNPKHPYTEALLSAVPRPDPEHTLKRMVLKGEVADPAHRPTGCPFHTRCPYAQDVCRSEEPELRTFGSGEDEQQVACHFAESLSLTAARGDH